MTKKFNTSGICLPQHHFMADTSKKLEKTMTMVKAGDYFVINRPRQYGKTTILGQLNELLQNATEYEVFQMSFEGIGDDVFGSEVKFVQKFIHLLAKVSWHQTPELREWMNQQKGLLMDFEELSSFITALIHKLNKKCVLIIDEVDKSSNNQLFLSFLGVLRDKFLKRHLPFEHSFQSVILAGVHDVKTLKIKIREGEEQKLNSPWNIAADFEVDLNFDAQEVKSMLQDYQQERQVQMESDKIAERIIHFSAGHPFLVSKLCKIFDEKILPDKNEKVLTFKEMDEAAAKLIKEHNVNFDSLIKNLANNEALYQLVYSIVIEGQLFPFNLHHPEMHLGYLYGIFGKSDQLKIHNRIYQEVIYNYMSSRMLTELPTDSFSIQEQYLESDKALNMETVLLKFQTFMQEQYSKRDRDFLERHGRLIFLAFLKPIINGAGYDFKEPQISDEKRLDIAITFNHHKYIAELKLWRGEKAHQKGLAQLVNYLKLQNLDKGYLVIFDQLNKKSWKSEWKSIGDKEVFIVWV